VMFPFVTNSVQRIVTQSMSDRAEELIDTVRVAEDEKAMVKALKDESHLLFFRIGLLDEKGSLLYDSHSKRVYGSHVYLNESATPIDVKKAFKEGIGYAEEYSNLLGQKLIYLSKTFDFQGKNYILRIAFPQEYIHELKKNFEVGFIVFSSLVLVLFSAMTGFILYFIMGPVRQIIRAITPYQEGKKSYIPEIKIRSLMKDEFSQLAAAFNSLSSRIKSQIETLTHERNEKEALLQSLAEGVVAVDHDMKISYANSMALNLLNLSKESIGKPFPKTFHPKCAELVTKCHEMNTFFNDALQIDQGEQKLHLNLVASPRQKQGGAILILQDKSIHYKILEMRKDFIANASHELKTPITVIRGFAETLHDNPNLDKETVHDITDKIVKNCSRMTKIVKNLLTLADIENLPQSRIQESDLFDIVRNCKSTLLAIYPHASINCHVQKGASFEFYCDPELMEVAVINLLDNAIKYAKEAPQIEVNLQREHGNLLLSVKDNGIGIPKQDLEHIFQRFYTVNKAHSKKLGGSGLGLSIVETIVEKHFGKISVESEIGVGSTFILELPDDLEARIKPKLEDAYAESRR